MMKKTKFKIMRPAKGYKVAGNRWLIGSQLAHGGPYLSAQTDGICWFHEGYLHREDGPAREWHDGELEKEWWLMGEQFEFDDWLNKTPISIEEKIIVKLRYI